MTAETAAAHARSTTQHVAGDAQARVRAVPTGLALVVGGTLLAQAVAIYTYQHVRLGDGFYPVTFVVRLLVPVLVGLWLLRMRPAEMGFAMPRMSRAQWLAFVGAGVALPLVALPFLEFDAYQQAYARERAATPEWGAALASFVAFTVSTTLPWEILHRGFLLHASRRVLLQAGAPALVATTTAILLTQSFEVLFHLAKPPLEAIAMAFASPLLSWLALRTRSLLVPVLLHVEVEIVFFLVVLR